MGSPGNYAPRFTPSPPLKGSFPLDHEHKCKIEMLEYMMCLKDKKQQSQFCREMAKEYFSCRMKHDLMDKDEWAKLGFNDEAHLVDATAQKHDKRDVKS